VDRAVPLQTVFPCVPRSIGHRSRIRGVWGMWRLGTRGRRFGCARRPEQRAGCEVWKRTAASRAVRANRGQRCPCKPRTSIRAPDALSHRHLVLGSHRHAAAVALSQAEARRTATIPLALAGVIGAIDHAAPLDQSRCCYLSSPPSCSVERARPRPTSDLGPHRTPYRRDRYCADAIHATTSMVRGGLEISEILGDCSRPGITFLLSPCVARVFWTSTSSRLFDLRR
jgi:hypothetical protein